MTRLGFVYPGGGAEHDYYRFAEANGFTVFLAGSRIPAGDDHDVEALRQTARTEHIVEAARRLMTLRVDAMDGAPVVVRCRLLKDAMIWDKISDSNFAELSAVAPERE